MGPGRRKRIFVSFAVEDMWARDLLRGQEKLGSCPIEYIDFSVRNTWDSAWKTQCRGRIRGCDGMIAFVSGYTRAADGARWEMECALSEDLPILGIWTRDTESYRPPELANERIVRWNWQNIATFIDDLP